MREVCIVGASLAGLLTALSLKSLPSFNITILEQRKEDAMQSKTGISLGSYAQDMIRKRKPYVDLKTEAVEHTGCVNFRADGKEELGSLPTGSKGVVTSSWSKVYSILRTDLDAYTGRYGAYIRLKYGCTVTCMEEIGGRISLGYRDGGVEKEESFDLVIGADGARSFVRSWILPNVVSEYKHYVAFRGEVSRQDYTSQLKLVQQGHLGFVQMPDSKSYILLYAKPSEDNAKSEDSRKVEWCWYRPCEDPSEYIQRAGGVYAKVTMDSKEWEKYVDNSDKGLPSWISQVIKGSESLSVSTIASFDGAGNVFQNGKVLLVGQACSEIEPYLGASCNVAAYQALHLHNILSYYNDDESWTVCLERLKNRWGPDMISFTQDIAARSKRAGMKYRGESDGDVSKIG